MTATFSGWQSGLSSPGKFLPSYAAAFWGFPLKTLTIRFSAMAGDPNFSPSARSNWVSTCLLAARHRPGTCPSRGNGQLFTRVSSPPTSDLVCSRSPWKFTGHESSTGRCATYFFPIDRGASILDSSRAAQLFLSKMQEMCPGTPRFKSYSRKETPEGAPEKRWRMTAKISLGQSGHISSRGGPASP